MGRSLSQRQKVEVAGAATECGSPCAPAEPGPESVPGESELTRRSGIRQVSTRRRFLWALFPIYALFGIFRLVVRTAHQMGVPLLLASGTGGAAGREFGGFAPGVGAPIGPRALPAMDPWWPAIPLYRTDHSVVMVVPRGPRTRARPAAPDGGFGRPGSAGREYRVLPRAPCAEPPRTPDEATLFRRSVSLVKSDLYRAHEISRGRSLGTSSSPARRSPTCSFGASRSSSTRAAASCRSRP